AAGVAIEATDVDHVRADRARSDRHFRPLIAADRERCGFRLGFRACHVLCIHGRHPLDPATLTPPWGPASDSGGTAVHPLLYIFHGGRLWEGWSKSLFPAGRGRGGWGGWIGNGGRRLGTAKSRHDVKYRRGYGPAGQGRPQRLGDLA